MVWKACFISSSADRHKARHRRHGGDGRAPIPTINAAKSVSFSQRGTISFNTPWRRAHPFRVFMLLRIADAGDHQRQLDAARLRAGRNDSSARCAAASVMPCRSMRAPGASWPRRSFPPCAVWYVSVQALRPGILRCLRVQLSFAACCHLQRALRARGGRHDRLSSARPLSADVPRRYVA